MGAARSANNKKEYPSSFIAVASVGTGLSNKEWDFLEKEFSSKWVEECPANIINSSIVKILLSNYILKLFHRAIMYDGCISYDEIPCRKVYRMYGFVRRIQ